MPSQALRPRTDLFPRSARRRLPPLHPRRKGVWPLTASGEKDLRGEGHTGGWNEGEPVLECAGGRQGRCDNYRQQFKQTN